ncbi:MAG: hypothetical protein K2M48_03560 [Clostridiales bacterium]|nr:hypothetical protein [Clostridiales bacterium]
MKKFVKPLVIATSVAAIAGIGAVSFAAWSGGEKEVTSTGALGDVTIVGFASDTATAWSNKLVPHDQPSKTYDATTCVTVASIELPKLTAVENQTITVKAEIQGYTATNDTADITYKNDLYVVAKEASEAEPSATDIITAAHKADGTGVVVLTVDSTGLTAADYKLYFALDSNDYAAKNLTYNITVTLSDAT